MSQLNKAYTTCTCGHIIFHHYNDGNDSCYFGPANQRPSEVECGCKGFKADNLRYLEELANAK